MNARGSGSERTKRTETACLRRRSRVPLGPLLVTQGAALLSVPATYALRALVGSDDAYVNAATTYSVSALYAHSTVSYANASGGYASWQKAIDENPESSINIQPTTDEAGMALKLATGHQLGRFAVLTGTPAKGKLDFFLVNT